MCFSVSLTFATVERKSAAWLSEVVRDVNKAKSSATDRVISAAFRFNPVRLLSPPARSLAGSMLSATPVLFAWEITALRPMPPANHIIFSISSAAAGAGMFAGACGGGVFGACCAFFFSNKWISNSWWRKICWWQRGYYWRMIAVVIVGGILVNVVGV